MEPTTLEDLLRATAEVIESFGGRIDVVYAAHLVAARATPRAVGEARRGP